jgi:LDH2 family malate/lactate/ureidoglycolate dehydrogenase
VTTYFQHERLIITEHQARSLTKIALRDAGVPAADAANVADALVDTSLRGIDTHGLRLLPQYLDELATGVANASARIRVIRDRGAGLLIDADDAVGVLAGLAELLSTVRAAAPANSPLDSAPGDPQHAHQRERRGRGIPLDARAADVLSALATSIGVPLRRAAVVTNDTDVEIAS